MALPSRALGALAAAAALTLLGPPVAAPAAVAPPWDPFFAAPRTVGDMNAVTPAVTDARAYGVAAGEFTGDGAQDLVVGRTSGHVAFLRGTGDGTFAAPAPLPWKQTTNNAWSMAAGDVNSDGKLDVVWGANTDSSGCSVPGTGCTVTPQVLDGEVRAWLGRGDGTFEESPYFVAGVRHNKGILLADVGTDAGSVAVADVDADGDRDVFAGSLDGTSSSVKLLRNAGSGAFTPEAVFSQPTATSGDGASPTYFPAIAPTTSPWGLAAGDADADGDTDLFVGDRGLYVYRYDNDGAGGFTIVPGNIPQIASRPNVYLRHDPAFRAAVGFTPSLAAGDVDGDGRADLAVGLHSGTQAKNTTTHDGEIVLNLTGGGRHELVGAIGDVGNNARGLQIVDVDGDGARDVVAGELEGKVSVLRQLTPRDADGDGVSDYVDNAPDQANAARLDMDTDGAVTYRDQLDNDGDTVLGDPEDEATWQRLGDAADPDDDNDGVADGMDNCRLVANAGQANGDGDGRGDACDPLDEADADGDGVPDGPMPGDALFEESRAAAIRWSRGDTHFVIRIDALGRLFQNEFTGLMTDAATLTPGDWAAKCQGMYDVTNDAGKIPDCTTLPGGKEVPVSLVVIPRLLWTDPEVIAWINDRNDDGRFELGQHGTYHASNTMLGSWGDQADRNFFSCELCGFTPDESYELLKAGKDTLLGDYDNPLLARGGATATSPKIDWTSSANPLVSYAPPFNASDDASREATAWLGYRAFSASVHEEGGGGIGQFFSPDEQAFERFDRYGVFHASADVELEPPETADGAYDRHAYAQYLKSETQADGLNTWLIEEVEWSGRPCNDLDRLADLCNGGSNREDNTVYRPRWDGWMQLLEYVKTYPGGVVMTLGDVALAKGYDNAPTVANPGQADGDHDGVGDVVEGVTVHAEDAGLPRGQAGTLRATLANGAGDPLAGQRVAFAFDADGDGTAEEQAATTDASGVASVTVTPSRPVGATTFDVAWDGRRGVTAAGTGNATVRDAATVTLDAQPVEGEITDTVQVRARLVDSDGAAIAGRSLQFSIGADRATGATDGTGWATASIRLSAPAGAAQLAAAFAGDADYGAHSASRSFTVRHEVTALTLDAPVTTKGKTTANVRLLDNDGAAVAGRTVELAAAVKARTGTTWTSIGSVVTGTDGSATATIPANHRSSQLRATFAGDASYEGSSVTR